ncbi:MAG TPA: IPTL-CTERM sorting domain-containing protein [Thermoanaerobaculia bacterium]
MIVPVLVFVAAVSLGRAESFSLLASAGVRTTGTIRVTGNVSAPAPGVTPVVGDVLPGSDALKDAAKAWNELAPSSDVAVSRLDSLITEPASTMRVNGFDSSHTFWLVNGSATLRARSTFVGTLIAMGDITVEEGVTVSGRLISLNGAIALDTDDINLCCDPDDGTPHTFTLFDGSLPPGTTLNPDGTLSGTATAPGVYTFIVLAKDSNGCSRIETRTVNVCGPTTVLPETLPGAVVGQMYYATISAEGTHRFTAGLPRWLSLTTACGPSALLSGMPKAADRHTFTITATECAGTCDGNRTYTLNVACPAITIVRDRVDRGIVGTPYVAMVHAEGGTQPYHYDVTPPASIVGIEGNGVLAVSVPSDSATRSFAVTATDVYGCSGNQSYAIDFDCPPITLSPASLPDGVLNEIYSVQFDGPYTFTSAGLPSWLGLTKEGLLSGTPLVPGDYTFTVTASVQTCSVDKEYTVHVPPCPVITISPTTLSRGTILIPYGPKSITIDGCASPCSISVEGNLPTGFTPLTPPLASPLTISGTPTAVGVFKFTVTATGPAGCSASQTYSIAIAPPSVPGAIVPVLSPWMLALMAALLAAIAVMRRGGA